jgi:toxin CcdB
MAQFDVLRSRASDLLIDCQSEWLRHLESRFVVPLMPLDQAPTPAGRLNPLFQIEGVTLSMVTQFAGSIDKSHLGELVCSLEDRRYDITGALDMLVGGY